MPIWCVRSVGSMKLRVIVSFWAILLKSGPMSLMETDGMAVHGTHRWEVNNSSGRYLRHDLSQCCLFLTLAFRFGHSHEWIHLHNDFNTIPPRELHLLLAC